MKKSLVSLMIGVMLLTIACSKDDDIGVPDPKESTPNVLFIIADDLGKDAMNGFSEGNVKPNTQNIDAIRNSGLSFTNFWTYPTCTPTRASIITGKYGYHSGVKAVGDVLNSSETSLQKYISDHTNGAYVSAIVGKWHLSGGNATFNPESFGIDYYAGLIRGSVADYYQWELAEDGMTNLQTNYITEKFTDLAIDWVNEQNRTWFLWLAYNAPHTPFHVPPSNMHNQGNLPEYTPGMDAAPYYMAAIEAMDFQIGRLLDSIPSDEKDNTIIIFIGDNGTPNQVAQTPYSGGKVKGTLYQGGINTPLFVSGKDVSRTGTDANLITSTDLFATISELAGVSVGEIHNSKSFKSLFTHNATLRKYQYSEMEDTWAISNGIYKLIEDINGIQEFYNLSNDPYEQNNVLDGTLTSNEMNVKSELETELVNIRE